MANNSGTQPPVSGPKSSSVRRNWIGLATVAIMAIALLYQINQTRILNDQLERQFAEPILLAEAFHRPSERIGLSEARDSIIEEFFLNVDEKAKQDPELSYVEILAMVLPISRELNPAPIRLDISIENVGNAAAEDVAVSIEWQGEIIAIDAESLSDWADREGGLGESEVTIWLERIAKGETATIGIEYAAYGEAKDTLVLTVDEPTGAALYSFWPVPSSEELSFPVFRIEGDVGVIDYDMISVVVGSDQTSVQVVEVEPIYSGLITALQGAAGLFPTPDN